MTRSLIAHGDAGTMELADAVVSPAAADELTALANEKYVWLDRQLGSRDHIVLDRFTLADLIVFCFISFGFTIGWKLPEGTPNLARLVEQTNQRPSAKVWQDSE